jgi:hypothetical protein
MMQEAGLSTVAARGATTTRPGPADSQHGRSKAITHNMSLQNHGLHSDGPRQSHSSDFSLKYDHPNNLK